MTTNKRTISKASNEAKKASLRVDRIRTLLTELARDAELLIADSRGAASRGNIALMSNDKLEQLEAALRNVREELHD